MPCYRPLKAFRTLGGGVVFNRGGEATSAELGLPCGRCSGCRRRRAREWALRCVHEASQWPVNSFVTLTYSPSKLPPNGSLEVSHWQRFAKRLRKAVGPFRFFHCGEYGERNLRPHYHAALFGVDFAADRVFLTERGGNKLYTSKLLEQTWGQGHVSIGELTYESAAYVARYVMKKAVGQDKRRYERISEHGEVYHVRPEYVTMSRRPGIGSGWFSKFKGDVFPSDEVVHRGRRYRPPRFYDERLPEAELEALKLKRRQVAAVHGDELSEERLKVREQVAEARSNNLRRDL